MDYKTDTSYIIKFYFVFLLAFFVLALIQGCASNGYDGADIDTTRKGILVANAEVRGANLLLQDLILRRAISQSQAQQAKDALQDAHNGLQRALDAVNVAGDPVAAETWQQRANRSLSVALTLLAPLLENVTRDNEEPT